MTIQPTDIHGVAAIGAGPRGSSLSVPVRWFRCSLDMTLGFSPTDLAGWLGKRPGVYCTPPDTCSSLVLEGGGSLTTAQTEGAAGRAGTVMLWLNGEI